MDIHACAQQIAERLADGRLTKVKPVKLCAGFGNAHRLCDGCGDPFQLNNVEHEHDDLEGGGTVRFHATCSVISERMIGARG